MRRTRIKICGVTRLIDALSAADAGADAVGIVRQAVSPRCVSLETAGQIMRALPAFVTPVLVYADEPAAQIASEARTFPRGLTLQIQRCAGPEVVGALADWPVIVAVHADPATVDASLRRWQDAAPSLANLKAILFETPGQIGGSGVENDWSTIARSTAADAWDGLPPFVVAGGLTPGNVGEVVRTLRPWAVDVSSGVEESRGVKSRERIEAFVRAVRQVDQDAA